MDYVIIIGSIASIVTIGIGIFQVVHIMQTHPDAKQVKKILAITAGITMFLLIGAWVISLILTNPSVQSSAIHPRTSSPTPTITSQPSSSPTATPTQVSVNNMHDWLVGLCNAVVHHNYTTAYNDMTSRLKDSHLLDDGQTYINCMPTYIHPISSVYAHCIIQVTTNDGANPYDCF